MPSTVNRDTLSATATERPVEPRLAGRIHCGSLWATLEEVGELLKMPLPNLGAPGRTLYAKRRIRQGEAAYRMGDPFESLYLVRYGFFKSVLLDEDGEEQVLAFPMKGDVLGIDGISGGRYASQAVALEDSEVVVVPFGELEGIGQQSASTGHFLFKLISRELVREHAIIWLLGTLGAEARVARFLAALSDRFAALGFSPHEFNLRMTRQEIGSYLGLTLETVSRSLSALHGAGLIRVEQRAIEIRDLPGLRALQGTPTRGRAARESSPSAKPARTAAQAASGSTGGPSPIGAGASVTMRVNSLS